MGGSVNLQGGGQYSMPNIQGYGQNAANMGQSAVGYGRRYGMGDYGPPPRYDGGYGDYGGQYGGGYDGVSTGGKGFQQPTYQPAPVLSPYVSTPQMSYDASTGGKGFQTRQTPSQSVAYAPMNIPQMQLAQPSFYYPNIGSQMANLNANYGMGGLGAMGAFGNYPMMPRQPAPMQMYPALQPAAPPPTSTGGKGFRTGPVKPSRPGYGPPTQPGYPPVGTGGKGFQPTPPTQPTYPNEPEYRPPGGEDVLRPVRPDVPDYGYDFLRQPDTPPTRDRRDFEPQEPVYAQPYTGPEPRIPEEYDRPEYLEPAPQQPTQNIFNSNSYLMRPPSERSERPPSSFEEPAYDTADFARPDYSPRLLQEVDAPEGARPDYSPTRPPVEQPAYQPSPMEPPQYRAPELPVETRDTSMPTYEQDVVEPFMGMNQLDLTD
jgi:hypothetical protein